MRITKTIEELQGIGEKITETEEEKEQEEENEKEDKK